MLKNEKLAAYKHLLKNVPGVNKALCSHKQGVSSFQMQDSARLLDNLNLPPDACFVDLGCGKGDYSFYTASKLVPKGKVFALDLWEGVTAALEEKAALTQLNNLITISCDITQRLPLENACADVCFTATVLHCLDLDTIGDAFFAEIKRILKPSGKLVTIDCNQTQTHCGPPAHIRIGREKLTRIAGNSGFEMHHYADLGFNYLCVFALK